MYLCCAGGRIGLLSVTIADGCCGWRCVRLFGRGREGSGGGRLRCPYEGCGQRFDKPSVLTDASVLPRESFYACPFCMSKIDVVTDKLKVVDVRAVDYPARVLDSPAKCARFSGVLGGNAGLADECLVCPKVLQCDARKK